MRSVCVRRALAFSVSLPASALILPLILAIPAAAADWRALPVIPVWMARNGGSLVVDSETESVKRVSITCPPMIQFGMTGFDVAVRFDSIRGVTEIYCGDYMNNRVVRHEVTPGLVHTETPLPIPYGVVWIAQDLDGDGQIELVVQRGDEGFGGNGYLDILSAPNWRLRERFVFPSMKVDMEATPVSIDADRFLEIYATPSSLGGAAVAVIIKYDSTAGRFRIVSEIAAPSETGGQPAIGDFDGDGRMEFISGSMTGYGLFEWQDTVLAYIGKVGQTAFGNHTSAVACRPKPGGELHALLGHSYGGFQYELMVAIEDNSFQLVHLFAESTAFIGLTPCFSSDDDCDGLDELAMSFYPSYREWEWDYSLGQFTERCAWGSTTYGSLTSWYATDLDRDNSIEWATVNHSNVFRAFPGPSCAHCDSTGRCHPPPPCFCPCSGDPQCDSVTNVVDVIGTINVAFRGLAGTWDSNCPRQRTDVDCSGATDVVDVVAVIDVAFRGADPAAKFCHPCPL